MFKSKKNSDHEDLYDKMTARERKKLGSNFDPDRVESDEPIQTPMQ
jgi:hypothetical protein